MLRRSRSRAYEHWWKECAEYSIRKAVNKAKKLGVVARVVEFNDEFVKATCPIYNETSVRQGKASGIMGRSSKRSKAHLELMLIEALSLALTYRMN